jgi:maltooligosyltrehalose trehalohydrolase
MPTAANTAPLRASADAAGTRRFPVGAEHAGESGVHFRVWAPASRTVAVDLLPPADRGNLLGYPRTVALHEEAGGYFSGFLAEARVGDRYKLRLDTGAFPDPASRFQPEGPHGPSQVVAPFFPWTDRDWRGRPPKDLVIYELHLGTFTAEGNWRAAAKRLPDLVELGITAVELMPIAEFPGKFGWGYDGVDLFAPAHLYGVPDDARAFVNRAHELGLAVILDVVYNHLGPDGNYLREFSPHYFSSRYKNEWGDPLNFDGEQSAPVREFFVSNARYWIEEFHLDGLRLDATQQIYDASAPHIVTEIVRAARQAAPHRHVCVIAENETQDGRLARAPGAGGHGLDALWNDDFHHSARVAATGHAEAYYRGYRGAAQEFVSCAKRGFLYQGQWYQWQNARRGHPALDLPPSNFVVYLQNHDQIANSLRGARLHQLTSPGKLRALTALTLLSPQIPLIFQGQEFASSAPFLYFADHEADLAKLVGEGRRRFLSQFPTVSCEESRDVLAPPQAEETFQRSKLDWDERHAHTETWRLHADLLRLRREDAALKNLSAIDGAVLAPRAFVLRYFSTAGDRLLLVNLDCDLELCPAPEPLLAPPEHSSWKIAWSSEAPVYGGCGTPPVETDPSWNLPGESAVWLAPAEQRELPRTKFHEAD